MQVTAAKIALNASLQAEEGRAPTQAVLTTTRDWVDARTLREGWAQMARRVRREVEPETKYGWFQEWTEGRNDGVRRTHYHSIWTQLDDDQGRAVAAISREVWARLAGAYSEKAHGSKPIWDAGGLARYVAGLVGHHLKANQAPPPGWSGRRFGTSRGFYELDSRELDRQAKAAVRDERLYHWLERAVLESCPDRLPESIVDDVVTARLAELRANPEPLRIIRL